MSKFAHYDAAILNRSNITGYYAEDIHGGRISAGGKIPDDAVEITEEAWADSIQNPGKYWVNPSTAAFEVAPPLSIQERLTQAKLRKSSELQAAASVVDIDSLSSNVLGTVHHYPLAFKNKQALMALAISARRYEDSPGWTRKIWCIPDGQLRPQRIEHTAQQILDLSDAVLDALASAEDALEAQLDAVDAATAIAEVNAITWGDA